MRDRAIDFLKECGFDEFEIIDSLADASSREYYRILVDSKSYILMDSSMMRDALENFVMMADKLSLAKVRVPKILKRDLSGGYLLLEDFGSTHLFDVISYDDVEKLYKKAISEIVLIQKSSIESLEIYDREFLKFEMDLMLEWYIKQYHNISLDDSDLSIVSTTIEAILDEVLSQKSGVVVHRDFHSKNLMILKDNSIGVIDFQDAKVGSVTYDLVSLLRDSYVKLDEDFIDKMLAFYLDESGLDVSFEELKRWFDFMGLQREIKILGIFARLSLRDGKDGYLEYIPQTLEYIVDVGSRYSLTKELATLLLKIKK